MLPFANQKLEAEGVDLEARLKANLKIVEAHLVLLLAGVEDVQMACNGKEQIVVVWRQAGKLVLEHLRHLGGAFAPFRDARLNAPGEEFIREFAKPVLEH